MKTFVTCLFVFDMFLLFALIIVAVGLNIVALAPIFVFFVLLVGFGPLIISFFKEIMLGVL